MVFLFPIATPMINAPQPNNPRFVIASWDYPDEYGQGIEKLSVFSNETGSWLPANWAGDSARDYDESSVFEWNASIFIRLNCWTWFNSTLTGAIDWEDGKNYQRHAVNVTSLGTTVFSQQNFTYASAFPAINPPMWYYEYEVILNFLPLVGQIYTVTVTYDVFYPEVVDSEQVAYAGDGTWQNSKVKDSTTWDIGGMERYAIYFHFSEPEGQIEGFEYVCYGEIFDVDVTLEVFNGTTNTTLFAFGFGGSQWYNGSSYGHIYNSSTIVLSYNSVGIGAGAFIDYLAIKFIYSAWNEVGEATLLFSVGYTDVQVFLGNVALIILGLVMIPVSTIYLAYGAKHDRSSNRLFYGLIMFFLGCGLFIGGILP